MRFTHISLLTALLLGTISLFAQVPQSINYQAMAFNGTTVYANQTFDVRFTLHLNSTTIYEEVHPSTTSNSQGLFVLKIGEGVPSSGIFTGIDWSGGPYSLKTELDPGSGYVLISDHSFSSVPYALFAERSVLPVGTEFEFDNDTLHMAQNGATLGQILKWNGLEWVPDFDASNTYVAGAGIDVSGSVITNTGDTDPTDDITTASIAGGDVMGTFPTLSVVGIQGLPVSNNAPGNNDVLKWSATNSQWEPKPDAVGSGGAFNITARLSGDGSIGAPLDIAQQGANTGQVLKWDGLDWTPANDSGQVYGLQLVGNNLTLVPGGSTGSVSLGTQYNAGPGINLVGGTIINTGDLDASDDITNGTAAAGDLSGVFPSPVVRGINGFSVANTTPLIGQIYKWNGTQWIPDTDAVNDADADPTNEIQSLSITGGNISISGSNTVVLPIYFEGAGIDITNNVISNIGDSNASDDITTSTTAGGDLSGLYPNPTVNGLAGFPLSSQSPGLNQVLKFNGTTWAPDADDDTDADADPTNEIQSISITGTTISLSQGGGSINTPIYLQGPGVNISGNVVSNTGDLNPNDDITTSTNAAGDVSGNFPTLTVDGLQGNPVANTTPSSGEVLKWNGTQWAPNTDDDTNTTYTAGTGLSLSGTTFTNTGDTDASDDITTASNAAGDLSGTFPTLTVDALQGNPIASTAPSSGEILKWNGTAWAPGSDDTGPWTETTGNAIHDGDIFLQNGSAQTRVAAGITPSDRGYINVYDEFNNLKAGIQINASGQGEVFGDSKSFRMEHPEDPNKEIWYASLEGPEAGAYARGTAELVNGTASISFPEHFQLIATADNMTIMLTPLSGDSEGLAVIEKTTNGFVVRELRNGTGNYRFDWEAKCIRQGFENFEVIRDRK